MDNQKQLGLNNHNLFTPLYIVHENTMGLNYIVLYNKQKSLLELKQNIVFMLL